MNHRSQLTRKTIQGRPVRCFDYISREGMEIQGEISKFNKISPYFNDYNKRHRCSRRFEYMALKYEKSLHGLQNAYYSNSVRKIFHFWLSKIRIRTKRLFKYTTRGLDY